MCDFAGWHLSDVAFCCKTGGGGYDPILDLGKNGQDLDGSGFLDKPFHVWQGSGSANPDSDSLSEGMTLQVYLSQMLRFVDLAVDAKSLLSFFRVTMVRLGQPVLESTCLAKAL